MPTLEEMTGWSLDELRAEIHAHLTDGLSFEESVLEVYWRVAYKDSTGNIVWSKVSFDLRLLLFDAYGWIWRRGQKASHPVWVPRSERKLVPVSRVGLPGITVPDPEDLDPKEVSVVYLSRLKR